MRNPAAAGLLLEGVSIFLERDGETFALYATGAVSLIGIDGATLAGTVIVTYNNTGAPTTLNTVPVAAGLNQVQGDGLLLVVAGQTLTGNYTITRSTGDSGATELAIAADTVGLTLGALPTGRVTVTDGGGSAIISSEGVAGDFAGTFTIANGGGTAADTMYGDAIGGAIQFKLGRRKARSPGRAVRPGRPRLSRQRR